MRRLSQTSKSGSFVKGRAEKEEWERKANPAKARYAKWLGLKRRG